MDEDRKLSADVDRIKEILGWEEIDLCGFKKEDRVKEGKSMTIKDLNEQIRRANEEK